VRPPRKLHRLRTAKPASDHARIDALIAAPCQIT